MPDPTDRDEKRDPEAKPADASTAADTAITPPASSSNSDTPADNQSGKE